MENKEDELRRAKREARKALRQRIAALDKKELEKSDQAIYNNVAALPELMAAKRVFLYCSTGHEVDTRKLISMLLARGQTVALPVSLPEGEMYFAAYNGVDQLARGRFFGILEPDIHAPRLEPAPGDLIVVPALAFDRARYRLGQGGGYYDRFLSRYSLYSVGLGRECLLCQQVPREAHDQPVNCLVTDGGVYR